MAIDISGLMAGGDGILRYIATGEPSKAGELRCEPSFRRQRRSRVCSGSACGGSRLLHPRAGCLCGGGITALHREGARQALHRLRVGVAFD